MKPLVWLVVFSVLGLTGCSGLLGPAARYDGVVRCKGKGVITGTGAIGITAGYGGNQLNSFTIQADCGEGFEYEHVRERTKIP